MSNMMTRTKGKRKNKKPMGRPTVMTPDTLAKLEEAFAMGCSDLEACLFADINTATLYRYQQENSDFRERKAMLKETLVLKARNVIATAIEKDDKVTATWYLERKRKDEFSTRQEQTGANGSPLTTPAIIIQPVAVNDGSKE